MVEIIKGRYGYRAGDETIRIAEAGSRISLRSEEEERLVRIGCAVLVDEPVVEAEAKKDKSVETTDTNIQEQIAVPPMPEPKTRKRKGRKE